MAQALEGSSYQATSTAQQRCDHSDDDQHPATSVPLNSTSLLPHLPKPEARRCSDSRQQRAEGGQAGYIDTGSGA